MDDTLRMHPAEHYDEAMAALKRREVKVATVHALLGLLRLHMSQADQAASIAWR